MTLLQRIIKKAGEKDNGKWIFDYDDQRNKEDPSKIYCILTDGFTIYQVVLNLGCNKILDVYELG